MKLVTKETQLEGYGIEHNYYGANEALRLTVISLMGTVVSTFLKITNLDTGAMTNYDFSTSKIISFSKVGDSQ